MRDDLPGFQQIIVDRGRMTAGSVNAVFGLTTSHDQMRDSGLVQHRLQRRFVKRTARSLLDNRFSVYRRDTLMDRPAVGMRFQRMPLSAVVPEVDHRNARGAGFG